RSGATTGRSRCASRHYWSLALRLPSLLVARDAPPLTIGRSRFASRLVGSAVAPRSAPLSLLGRLRCRSRDSGARRWDHSGMTAPRAHDDLEAILAQVAVDDGAITHTI